MRAHSALCAAASSDRTAAGAPVRSALLGVRGGGGVRCTGGAPVAAGAGSRSCGVAAGGGVSIGRAGAGGAASIGGVDIGAVGDVGAVAVGVRSTGAASGLVALRTASPFGVAGSAGRCAAGGEAAGGAEVRVAHQAPPASSASPTAPAPSTRLARLRGIARSAGVSPGVVRGGAVGSVAAGGVMGGGPRVPAPCVGVGALGKAGRGGTITVASGSTRRRAAVPGASSRVRPSSRRNSAIVCVRCVGRDDQGPIDRREEPGAVASASASAPAARRCRSSCGRPTAAASCR